ncbi:probable inactive purple acid phosphatase 16 [Folsomia candida]|uniref:Putative inactive purple acid phosphatase 16 n=1 Tax=Folsomia candida TaxID=158441 RepID=A0A226EJI5_FOLCA|nr:probable inactive purple acid phosphatase 16 [Folsomia candida]OXA57883.1 putative inactive purple acid phosphatase 16 [Folsomia candida]
MQLLLPITASTLIFSSYLLITSYSNPPLPAAIRRIPPQIRLNQEGRLKIVIFADLHYGEEPSTIWGPIQDIRSTNLTGRILDWETPQLVIFTGDQLTAENMYPNASVYVDMLVGPLVTRGYRWASTYGNHDIGPNVTRLEILRAEQKYANSYTQQMTDSSIPGVTNYYLLIYSVAQQPVMIFWFLDSQGGRNGDGQQPEYIDAKVVDWFIEENARLKEQFGPLPSLVFFHIPTEEFIQIQENIHINPVCSGLVDDDVTPQHPNNTGIMDALSNAGGVQAVYVGHDHGNGWCCFYKEIQVCYGRHTGFGGYGSWVRGARVVNLVLNSDNSVILNGSYVRLETGAIVDEFPKLVKV